MVWERTGAPTPPSSPTPAPPKPTGIPPIGSSPRTWQRTPSCWRRSRGTRRCGARRFRGRPIPRRNRPPLAPPFPRHAAMTRRRFPPLPAAMLAAGCARPSTENPAAAAGAANPFLTPSPLQYQAPPFDRIRDAHYQPAIEQGMKENLAEIEKIASQDPAPTFVNTIEAMERSGILLTRVLKVFFAMTQANTDDTLQKVQAEEAPRLAAHHDAIYLNPRLFQRVKTLY